MKPEELIERTRAFYQMALVDLEQALELYVATEGFVWENPLPAHIPFGGTHEGHDGLRRYLALVNDAIEMNEFEFGEMVAQGDTVMAAGHAASRIRAKWEVLRDGFRPPREVHARRKIAPRPGVQRHRVHRCGFRVGFRESRPRGRGACRESAPPHW